MNWESLEKYDSSSTELAILSCWTVQIRTTPSEHAVTTSPFSKNLVSQTQPGCSMLWTQTPSATQYNVPGKISYIRFQELKDKFSCKKELKL